MERPPVSSAVWLSTSMDTQVRSPPASSPPTCAVITNVNTNFLPELRSVLLHNASGAAAASLLSLLKHVLFVLYYKC